MEDLPAWARITGVAAAVLLIPAVCLVGKALQRFDAWRNRRPHRWRHD